MAHFAKSESKDHLLRLRADGDEGELLIVGRRNRPTSIYLWTGRDAPGSGVCTFSGQAKLRKLAHALLWALRRPETK